MSRKTSFFCPMKTWKPPPPPQKLANLQKCSCFLFLVQICGYIVHTGYPIYVVVAIFELDMQAMLIRSNVRGTNYSVLG